MTHDEAVALLYRFAAKAAHPDSGGTTESMQRVNAANAVLRACSMIPVQAAPLVPGAADERLTFGKHKGKRLRDVPITYLAWCMDNLENETWREMAETVYEWRMA